MKSEGYMTVNGRSLKYVIDGNTLKGAHKGFIKIPVIPKAKLIEKIFLMDNDITSLNGITSYPNLKVLSLESNKITKLNEILLLSKLPLQNVNLSLNPVTKLPFYEQFVVANIPSLLQFDSKRIDDKIRQKAIITLEKEKEHLNQLCANELKIASLENLVQQAEQEGVVLSQSWLENAKAVISSQSIIDFEITDEEKQEKFELFREEAEKFRRESGNLRRKWFDIYRTIEEMQGQVINGLIAQIEELIAKSKDAISSYSNSRYHSRSISPKTPVQTRTSPPNPIRDTPYQQPKISPIHRTKESIYSEIISMSPMPRPPLQIGEMYDEVEDDLYENDNVPPLVQKMLMKRMKSAYFNSWKQVSLSNVDNRIVDTFIHGKEKASKSKIFYKWLSACNKAFRHGEDDVQSVQHYQTSSYNRPIKLVIQNTVSIRKPFKPTLQNTPENIELLEESQRLARTVSELQANLEKQIEENQGLKNVLDESVKRCIETDTKLENFTNENAALKKQLADEQRKYENEVFHLMMENRMKSDDNKEKQFADMKNENAKLSSENKALKQYIAELQKQSEAEIHDLKSKLAAAFEVAGGLRQKIDKLSYVNQQQAIARVQKGDLEISSSPVYANALD